MTQGGWDKTVRGVNWGKNELIASVLPTLYLKEREGGGEVRWKEVGGGGGGEERRQSEVLFSIGNTISWQYIHHIKHIVKNKSICYCHLDKQEE